MNFLTQHLSNLRGELIVLLVLFVVCFIITYVLGRGRSVAFILSFYPAIFLYSQFPLTQKLVFLTSTPWHIFLNKLGIFLIFFLATFLILSAITGRSLVYSGRSSMTKMLVLALFCTGLILIVITKIIPTEKIAGILNISGPIFASQTYFFWFLALPILFILLFGRK